MSQKWFNRLATIAGILFILLWLMLHFFNRFAADDYQLIYERFHYGILDATIHQYVNWCGRWAPLGFTYTLISFADIPGFLFAYGILTITAFVIAAYRFFWVMSTSFLPKPLPNRYILAVGIFFIMTFFLLTPEKSEVWFWYNSTSMYLWNLIFFMFGTSFLIWDRGKTEYIFIAISYTYIGSASEPFAMVVIGALAAIVVYRALFNIGFSFKFLFAMLAALMGFGLNIIAEGNEVRASYLPPASGWNAVHNMGRAVYHIFAQHAITFVPLILLLLSCWIMVGMRISAYYQPFSRFKPGKLLFATAVLAIIWVGILFPSAYTLGGVPPQRVQGAMFFVLAIFVAIKGLYIGMSVGRKPFLEAAGLGSILVIIAFNGYLIVNHARIEPVYAKAVDTRIIFLEKYKEEGNEATIYLDPLPDPGYLHPAEITKDTSRALNEQLKAGLGLNFNVALKP